MQVSVESPTSLVRRVTIIVPVEKFDEAFDKRILKLSKTAKIKGFRPGKVPLNYVKQYYGDSARQEALSELIQSSLYDAINQENLNPVSTPNIEPKSIVPGQPVEFVATFEVLPTIESVHFDVSTLEKKTATVEEIDVQNVIDRLCMQQTTWHPVTRPSQDKDQVVIDFRGTIDGVAFPGGEAHDYPIILGSKTMLPGFEDGLIGVVVDQEKTLQVPFPENYFAKEVSGKTAVFAIKVHQVSEPELPKLNEDFIKKIGIKSGSLEDLHTEIRKNIERELARIVKAKLKTQVFDKLIEQNPIEVPQSLIAQEAERLHHELHPHHKEDEHHGHSPEEMAGFNEAAKRSVILGLLIAELAKQKHISPDREKMKAFISNLATAYENPAEIMQWYAKDKRRMAEVEMQVLEEQIVDNLLENVTVTEKALSYNELVAQ